MNYFLLDNKSAIKDPRPCGGLLFKCESSVYYDEKRSTIGERHIFMLLKRKSCTGCSTCHPFWNLIQDIGIEQAVVLPAEPKTGQIYTPVFVEVSRDREEGYVDEYYYEMHIYEPTEAMK